MSIQADDGFNLKMALECELDGVVPYDGLAGSVITRYRRAIRRRVAGAVSVVVTLAGIGVPLGLLSAGSSSGGTAGTGPTGSGPVLLRLASYTLKLPSRYRSSYGTAARCAIGIEERPAQTAAATSSSGGCLLMTLAPAGARQEVPPSAEEVAVGRYRAWLVPSGYWPGGRSGLVIDRPGSDLVIASSGLSAAALVSLVSAGLS